MIFVYVLFVVVCLFQHCKSTGELCGGVKCGEYEVCADDNGEPKCRCELNCLVDRTFCSDTCQELNNECAMNFYNCYFGTDIKKESDGPCPEIVKPTYMEEDEEVVQMTASEGVNVEIQSGLKNSGTPSAKVSWVFRGLDEVEHQIEWTGSMYSFVLTTATVGEYEATITQCRDASYARTFTTTVMMTEAETTSKNVCSVFPGGVIESFDGAGTYYDLACSHVLAADVLSGGTYADPWFVYGTFDDVGGKGALRSMTIYGSVAFEIQRGWLVNVGGRKMDLLEGVEQSIEGSGCSVKFADQHLKVECGSFTVYYDGIMAGHIKINGPDDVTKGVGSFGLCYDSDSGFRKNWQVGNTFGVCEITTGTEACQEGTIPGTCDIQGACGLGVTTACNELYCGSALPTGVQKCALRNANLASCSIKNGAPMEVDSTCPEDCMWKNYVVAQGCPQKEPPFDCP